MSSGDLWGPFTLCCDATQCCIAPVSSGDLWGPLILCTILAVTLQGSPEGEPPASKSGALANDGGPEFAEVFVIVWVGSAVVTLNTKLLGGSM